MRCGLRPVPSPAPGATAHSGRPAGGICHQPRGTGQLSRSRVLAQVLLYVPASDQLRIALTSGPEAALWAVCALQTMLRLHPAPSGLQKRSALLARQCCGSLGAHALTSGTPEPPPGPRCTAGFAQAHAPQLQSTQGPSEANQSASLGASPHLQAAEGVPPVEGDQDHPARLALRSHLRLAFRACKQPGQLPSLHAATTAAPVDCARDAHVHKRVRA